MSESETTVSQTAVNAAATSTESRPASQPAGRKTSDATPKKDVKTAVSLEDLLTLLDEQDRSLKELKEQTQAMLATNSQLRKGIKVVVKQASRNEILESELAVYKKKWSTLKGILS